MNFEIVKSDKNTKARLGVLHTPHGEIHTPAFMPIGTKGTVKTLSSDEVKSLGAEVILANTYHLWISGDETIAKAGGLHKFMNWSRPIMTDSGGFQLFSLGEKRNPSNSPYVKGRDKNSFPLKERGIEGVSITEEGVVFLDEISGAEHMLTPEKSVQIQNNLGSDIQVVLDEFTGDINNFEKVKATVERTTRWAKRARAEFKKALSNLTYEKIGDNISELQYAVVQGGMFEDLRRQSASDLSQLDFEGYCIGGVAVGGESSDEQYKAVEMSVPYLPEDKPRHLLGVGTPDQIVEAVKRGIDTFDCVIPTREARHGKAYTNHGTCNIEQGKYKEDFSKLDETCDCEACTKYTKAYLHHLFKAGEILGLRLLTMHNVRFYLRLMEKIREKLSTNSIF